MSKYGHRPHNWFEAIVNMLGGEEAAEKFLRGELVVSYLEHVESAHTLTVNYDLPLADMVKVGGYGWVDENITPTNFPPSGKGTMKVEGALFHFGKSMKSEAVITEMEKQGYRPATIAELLALGQTKPDLQREYPIVALGSSCVVGGNRSVPCLFEGSRGRHCCLLWFVNEWRGGCRFLGVRK